MELGGGDFSLTRNMVFGFEGGMGVRGSNQDLMDGRIYDIQDDDHYISLLVKNKLNSSFFGSVFMGAMLDEDNSIGVRGGYLQNNLGSKDVRNFFDISNWFGMVYLNHEFRSESFIRPYVRGGVGLTHTKGYGQLSVAEPEPTSYWNIVAEIDNLKETVLAYEVGVGLSYCIGGNTKLSIGYLYFGTKASDHITNYDVINATSHGEELSDDEIQVLKSVAKLSGFTQGTQSLYVGFSVTTN